IFRVGRRATLDQRREHDCGEAESEQRQHGLAEPHREAEQRRHGLRDLEDAPRYDKVAAHPAQAGAALEETVPALKCPHAVPCSMFRTSNPLRRSKEIGWMTDPVNIRKAPDPEDNRSRSLLPRVRVLASSQLELQVLLAPADVRRSDRT